jgi:class 3 adenylate cyclase
MIDPPETNYVSVGNSDVGYQVHGSGPTDLVYFTGFGHLDLRWDDPLTEQFLERLATFSRVISFDRRGAGVSDAIPHMSIPTWEEWTEDLDAVLDATEAENVAIYAERDAGPIAVLYAALHPERVSRLVLANTAARFLVADDYPIGMTVEQIDGIVDFIGSNWGRPGLLAVAAPSRATDPEYLKWQTRIARAAATPRFARAQYRHIFLTTDVRHVLNLVQAPTLVLHTAGNALVPVAMGQYLADHIPDARLVTHEAEDILLRGGDGTFEAVDAVAEFITGTKPPEKIERILTTVLFTDIVGSTEHAASMGDRAWRSLLDSHDQAVRRQIHKFDGREINWTGDGFMVAFNGPARAIRCAHALADEAGRLGLQIRAGLHTGECEVRGENLGGLAVHIAARITALAAAEEVLVSSTVCELVLGSGIGFDDRGPHQLKGVPGNWHLFVAQRG